MAFFKYFLEDDVSAGRLIHGRLGGDNAEVTLSFED
jgi:hypothetical protein